MHPPSLKPVTAGDLYKLKGNKAITASRTPAVTFESSMDAQPRSSRYSGVKRSGSSLKISRFGSKQRVQEILEDEREVYQNLKVEETSPKQRRAGHETVKTKQAAGRSLQPEFYTNQRGLGDEVTPKSIPASPVRYLYISKSPTGGLGNAIA